MTFKRKELGKSGEEKALQFLLNKKYNLVARNIRLFCGEIDILAKDGNTYVIVEVKTKSNTSFGLAQEMVNYKKKRKLLQLAKALLLKYPKINPRIDVVAVDEENDKIEHFISAVEE